MTVTRFLKRWWAVRLTEPLSFQWPPVVHSGIVVTTMEEYARAFEQISAVNFPILPLGGRCDLRVSRIAGTVRGHVIPEATA